MSEKKYTPGPWFMIRDGFSTVYVEARLRGSLFQEVAACGPTEQGPEQQEANARLIACAPELLEMLEKARNTIASFPRSLAYDITDLPEIDAIIAKAKGSDALTIPKE